MIDRVPNRDPPNAKKTVLIAEDEQVIARGLQHKLQALGYEVLGIVDSGQAIVQRAVDTSPDLILMDIRLRGEMDGITAAKQIRRQLDLPVVFVTGYTDPTTVDRAKVAQPYGYLSKPIETNELRSTLELALYQHQMEQKLRESEARYRLLAENTTDMISRYDLGGISLYVSEASRTLLGCRPEELVGKALTTRVHPNDVSLVELKRAQLVASKKDARIEFRLQHANGQYVWVESTCRFSAQGSSGHPEIICVTRDISERKQVEDALRESQAALDKAQQLTDIGSYVWDLTTDELTWSRNMYAIAGLDPDSFAGKLSDVSNQIIHPEDQAKVAAQVTRMVEERQTWPIDFRIIHNDGTVRYLRSASEFMLNDQDIPVRCIGVHYDLTKQRQTERTLHETETLLQGLSDNSPAPIFVKDTQGRYVYCNREFEASFDAAQGTLLGQTDADLFADDPELIQLLQDHDRQVLDGEAPLDFIEALPAKGERRRYISTKFPLWDQEGEIFGLGCIATDITERIRTQEALQQAKEDLDRAQHIAHFGSWRWNIAASHSKWSDELYRIYGLERDQTPPTMEQHLPHIHPDDRETLRSAVRKALAREDYCIDYRIRRYDDGQERIIHAEGEVLYDDDNQPLAFLGIAQDVTYERQMEQDLREAHNRLERQITRHRQELSTLYQVAAAATHAIDLRTGTQEILQCVLNTTDCCAGIIHLWSTGDGLIAASDQPAMALPTVISSGIAAETIVLASKQHSSRSPNEVEFAVDRPISGADVSTDPRLPDWLRTSHLGPFLIIPVQIRHRTIGLIALFRQRTQPVFDRNEFTLLSTVADQVGLIVESATLRIEAERAAVLKERQRLARDLHDSVTQSLYSVTLLAETSRLAAQARDLETIEDCQRRLGQTTQQALREMRLLIYELGPPLLKEHGLVGALQQRLDTVESRAGMNAHLQVAGPLDLDSGSQEALYRIALEALNNTLKHARAEQVEVSITDKGNIVELVVSDNGCGFDPPTSTGGMGLNTMRERATQLQGCIQFDSAPETGTTITVHIPYKQSAGHKVES